MLTDAEAKQGTTVNGAKHISASKKSPTSKTLISVKVYAIFRVFLMLYLSVRQPFQWGGRQQLQLPICAFVKATRLH